MATPSFLLLQGDPSTWGLPPTGKTYAGVNTSGQIVLKQHDGTVTIVESGAPSLHKQANNSVTPIAVTPTSSLHTEVVTVTGAARTTPLLIGGTSQSDGARCAILFKLPATANIIIEIYSDAELIATLQNQTGALLKATLEFFLDAGVWAPLTAIVPAYEPAS